MAGAGARAIDGRYIPVGEWATHGPCIGHVTSMEMPVTRGRGRNSPGTRLRITNAKAICHSCPVQTECREWALTDPDPAEYMIAGGLTPAERQTVRL